MILLRYIIIVVMLIHELNSCRYNWPSKLVVMLLEHVLVMKK